MQESQIVKLLNENELADVEVLKRDEEYVLVNFYFDFDKENSNTTKQNPGEYLILKNNQLYY